MSHQPIHLFRKNKTFEWSACSAEALAQLSREGYETKIIDANQGPSVFGVGTYAIEALRNLAKRAGAGIDETDEEIVRHLSSNIYSVCSSAMTFLGMLERESNALVTLDIGEVQYRVPPDVRDAYQTLVRKHENQQYNIASMQQIEGERILEGQRLYDLVKGLTEERNALIRQRDAAYQERDNAFDAVSKLNAAIEEHRRLLNEVNEAVQRLTEDRDDLIRQRGALRDERVTLIEQHQRALNSANEAVSREIAAKVKAEGERDELKRQMNAYAFDFMAVLFGQDNVTPGAATLERVHHSLRNLQPSMKPVGLTRAEIMGYLDHVMHRDDDKFNAVLRVIEKIIEFDEQKKASNVLRNTIANHAEREIRAAELKRAERIESRKARSLEPLVYYKSVGIIKGNDVSINVSSSPSCHDQTQAFVDFVNDLIQFEHAPMPKTSDPIKQRAEQRGREAVKYLKSILHRCPHAHAGLLLDAHDKVVIRKIVGEK
jgi:DNA repair exonuclease SbcCD ATPase subunit|nr:MAG TPA: chromosome segregation protein [Caudoviricetes sp.]